MAINSYQKVFETAMKKVAWYDDGTIGKMVTDKINRAKAGLAAGTAAGATARGAARMVPGGIGRAARLTAATSLIPALANATFANRTSKDLEAFIGKNAPKPGVAQALPSYGPKVAISPATKEQTGRALESANYVVPGLGSGMKWLYNQGTKMFE